MDATQGSGTNMADQTAGNAGDKPIIDLNDSRSNFDAMRLKQEQDEQEDDKSEVEQEENEDNESEDETTEDDKDTQLTGKDARHATKKINEEIRKKTIIAERLLEKDPDAIYEIAEDDPKLAAHLLKIHKEYGAGNVADLIRNRDMEGADLTTVKKVAIATTRDVEVLKKKLVDSEVLRLRGDNPDLEGELEDKFRELVQHSDYENVSTDRIVNVARALLGKEPVAKRSNASDVAEEMLNAAQGSMPSVRSGIKKEATNSTITPEMREMMQRMGVSEKKYLKYQSEGKL